MADLFLAFGSTTLPFEVDSKVISAILMPKPFATRRSPETLILDALANPIGCKPIAELVRPTQKVTIIIPDKTRQCGAALFLPLVIEKLNASAIPDADIDIVLANGSHPSHDRKEISKLVGSEIGARINLVEHDSKNADDLVFLGSTKFGTPVSVNRRVLETDVVLVTGTVVHHYFAGYGGGAKMINPGCAAYETITKNHALTIDRNTGRIHPKCRVGVLAGNPVQDDILDSMRFLRADFSLATILNPQGEIAAAMCGELFATHEKARHCIDEHYKVAIAERADVVVVSCGGFPKDINLIQVHKSIHNAFQAVKKGGVLLVLAECAQGIGSETFLDWFEYEDDEALKAALVKQFTLNATTALSLKSKAEVVKIILISKLPETLVMKLGLTPAKTLAEGWRQAGKMLPENFTAFVIPNGSLTLPVLN